MWCTDERVDALERKVSDACARDQPRSEAWHLNAAHPRPRYATIVPGRDRRR